MIKTLLLCGLTLALCSGCLFSRKSDRKSKTAISAEVEDTFRKRWVDRRVTELVAGGATAEAARPQAEADFLAAYNFPKGR